MKSSLKHHKERLRAVRQDFNYLQVFHDLIHDPDGYDAEAEESWRARLEAEISKDNVMKQRGFYVDVDGDVVLEPSLISAVQARAIVEDAEQAIGLMGSLMESNGQGAEGSS